MSLKKWLRAAVVIFAAVFVLGFYFFIKADQLGQDVGASAGKAVGWAVGSYKGFTEGKANGERDGKAVGLSADDTQSDLVVRLGSIGRLEVLAAGVKLTNVHSIGEDYSAIYLMKGSAVYTVDLEKAQFAFSPDQKYLTITVPEPEIDLYVDENETKKLAEYQKHFYTGSTRDGFLAYLNTSKNTVKEVRDSMANYDELMSLAKESAVSQISRLAAAVCEEGTEVEILISGSEQEVA